MKYTMLTFLSLTEIQFLHFIDKIIHSQCMKIDQRGLAWRDVSLCELQKEKIKAAAANVYRSSRNQTKIKEFIIGYHLLRVQ